MQPGATPLGVVGSKARMCQLDCHYGKVKSNSTYSQAIRHDLLEGLEREEGLTLQIKAVCLLSRARNISFGLILYFTFIPKEVADFCLILSSLDPSGSEAALPSGERQACFDLSRGECGSV